MVVESPRMTPGHIISLTIPESVTLRDVNLVTNKETSKIVLDKLAQS